MDEVHNYYEALFELNIQTDMISIEENLDHYELVIAPVMYMIKPGFAEKVEAFVARGGTFITTFFSGIVNENDLVTTGGYPGKLRNVLGIWAEEIDALLPGQENQIVMKGVNGALSGTYTCNLLCDLIHTEGAEVVAEYGSDFYKGMPAVTMNKFGKGEAWYIASSPDQHFLQSLFTNVCKDKGIEPLLAAPSGVEVTRRNKDGKSFTFILNHNAEAARLQLQDEPRTELLSRELVSGAYSLAAKGVMIIEQ